MGKLITVSGYTFQLSGQTPSTVTFAVTATPVPAKKTKGAGKALIIEKIVFSATCSGSHSGHPYAGSGSATLVGSSTKVKCEQQAIVLVGDKITISCTGAYTPPSSSPVPADASVTVTVTNTNQTKIRAS